MRIALANWTRRLAGGAETYIHTIARPLGELGHDIALFAECDAPADRETIGLGAGSPVWTALRDGTDRALRSLREWSPDIIFVNGIDEPNIEERLLGIAPAVLCGHNYYGTCISGSKTLSFPHAKPCGRRFGPTCLLHYYPRRCGGLSPRTMVADYRRQRHRLHLLQRYRGIVTLSEHMRREFLNHGTEAATVHVLPAPVTQSGAGEAAGGQSRERPTDRDPRLLFLGRLDRLKGGAVLLDALPLAAADIGRGLRVTFAGDGPARSQWEARAARLRRRAESTTVEFAGWVDRARMPAMLAETDLLVLPSLWPEPFGLVGLEAGLHGVPTAAFAVGGITEWLEDGVNGHLAPSPSHAFSGAAGLAAAIVACLRDPTHYGALSDGAVRAARSHTPERHASGLIEVLERAANA